MDYVSAGHFEVFHELINEAETFADGSGDLAKKLMPAIADTTEVIMAYEEKYGESSSTREKIKRDLSALGEASGVALCDGRPPHRRPPQQASTPGR